MPWWDETADSVMVDMEAMFCLKIEDEGSVVKKDVGCKQYIQICAP